MIDTDTPTYIGYDANLKAYHFRVTGDWNNVCGTDYCWPLLLDTQDDPIGTDDAVRIGFSDAVQFMKLTVTGKDACGDVYWSKSETFPNGTGDKERAFAAVRDVVFLGWQKTTYLGDVVTNEGPCKLGAEPTHSYSARGYTTTLWADMKARAYQLDAWVNPIPSQGDCYDHLRVSGGYAHTWTTQSLSWSVGYGYPWGFGPGVGIASSSDGFTVWQSGDGYSDPDLVTGRLCNH